MATAPVPTKDILALPTAAALVPEMYISVQGTGDVTKKLKLSETLDRSVAQTVASGISFDNLTSQYDGPPAGNTCAIIKTPTAYQLYSPLSFPGIYALEQMERTTSADYRPTTRGIRQFLDVYHEVFDAFIRSGAFTGVANTAAIGGYYAGSNASGAYVEKTITLDGAINIVSLIFATRNSCSDIAVAINGGSALANLLPTNGLGEKYIAAYSVDAAPKVNQTAVIAILPAGVYAIRLTASAARNPANTTGFRLYPQAISVVGGTAGLPGGAKTHAPNWVNAEAVLTSYQRYFEGKAYRATNAGMTNGTSPLNDTVVAWVETPDNYALLAENYATDVSECFWAFNAGFDGAAKEDFGGDLHGNVVMNSLFVEIGGQVVTPTDYQPIYGSTISVIQNCTGSHTASPGTAAFNFIERYTAVVGGDFQYKVNFRLLQSASFGWCYAGMLPLYHYNVSAFFRYQLRKAIVQGVDGVNPSSYYGLANPVYGAGKSLQIMGLIDIASAAGAAGVPAVNKEGIYQAAVSLEMTNTSMQNFTQPGARTYWDMNTSGVNVSAGGFTGMVSKGYYQVSDGSVDWTAAAFTDLTFEGVYRVRLSKGSAGKP